MRTKEEIQKEYYVVASKAGDLQYRILCFQAELQSVNEQMNSLNQEMIALDKPEVTDGEG